MHRKTLQNSVACDRSIYYLFLIVIAVGQLGFDSMLWLGFRSVSCNAFLMTMVEEQDGKIIFTSTSQVFPHSTCLIILLAKENDMTESVITGKGSVPLL